MGRGAGEGGREGPFARPVAHDGAAEAAGTAAVSERTLVARLKGGDEAAFEEIVKRYELKVFNLTRGLLRHDDDAQDAIQETFLSVFRNIGRFKENSSLSTWIYRIAVNSALMKIRKRRHDQKNVTIEEYMPEFDDTGHRVAVVPDWHPAVDQLLLNKELGGLLRTWIAELAPEYRTVFLLRDQEELDNEQVAEILGLSIAAVKSRLHRARLYLRERAKRYVYGGGA
ncbi:MAG TPA: sigma-70 family RNA polymerase sigma factor [Candidatus Polarisedimenticolia bacterium]|nr:sigma-70 family RNA polymerase sigma factor [Candidatus Polarisedimenticolia bacterium]